MLQQRWTLKAGLMTGRVEKDAPAQSSHKRHNKRLIG